MKSKGGHGRNGNRGSTAVGMSFIKNEPDAARGLLRALRNTAVSVVYQNRDLQVVWAQNVPASWASGNIVGLTDGDFLPSPMAERVTAAKRTVLTAANPDRLEVSIPNAEGAQWFDLWIDADYGADGDVRGIITTAVETTEQKRREQTLRALLREVSHRSRNLLAIIQSIATQTGRYSVTIEGFLNRFRGRLQSLASSQDLVTSSNWRGADLGELVIGQVGRYSPVAAHGHPFRRRTALAQSQRSAPCRTGPARAGGQFGQLRRIVEAGRFRDRLGAPPARSAGNHIAGADLERDHRQTR